MQEFSHFYLALPTGPPTQGDIWINLPCPTLRAPTGVALVVTPRCDFAHDKTPIFNYVPAVALDTYIEEAHSRLLERELIRLKKQVINFNIPLPAYELLEIGASPESIVDELEKEAKATELAKRASANVQEFRESVDKMSRIRHVLESQVRESALSKSLIPPREMRTFREQVLHNQLNDVHMLPPCLGVSEQAMVLLLRHISSCDIRCLQLAYSCVTVREWEQRVARHTPDVPALSNFRGKPERIARLKSPYLENVVSRFATLFMRFGVPELTATEFTSLIRED